MNFILWKWCNIADELKKIQLQSVDIDFSSILIIMVLLSSHYNCYCLCLGSLYYIPLLLYPTFHVCIALLLRVPDTSRLFQDLHPCVWQYWMTTQILPWCYCLMVLSVSMFVMAATVFHYTMLSATATPSLSRLCLQQVCIRLHLMRNNTD